MKTIIGTVIRGIQKSRKLGFPTANVSSDSDLVAGIYAGCTIIDGKKYNSALYSSGNNIIETFIFDFSGDLYGKEVGIKVMKKIRNKKKFKDDSEAIEQITKDILAVKKYFKVK